MTAAIKILPIRTSYGLQVDQNQNLISNQNEKSEIVKGKKPRRRKYIAKC